MVDQIKHMRDPKDERVHQEEVRELHPQQREPEQRQFFMQPQPYHTYQIPRQGIYEAPSNRYPPAFSPRQQRIVYGPP